MIIKLCIDFMFQCPVTAIVKIIHIVDGLTTRSMCGSGEEQHIRGPLHISIWGQKVQL